MCSILQEKVVANRLSMSLSMEMYGSFAEANNNVTETELGYIKFLLGATTPKVNDFVKICVWLIVQNMEFLLKRNDSPRPLGQVFFRRE